jgi:phosphate transport system substrate-binding protein
MMSRRKVSALLAASAFVVSATAGLAEKITLKSNDGAVVITGELVSFENGFYTIRSNMGMIGIVADRVTCSGEACPDTKEVAQPVAPAAVETVVTPEPVVEPVVAPVAEVVPETVKVIVAEPAAEAVVVEPVVAEPVAAEPVLVEPVYETVDPATIDFTVKGSDTVGDELMPLLIKGAAESLGAVVKRREVGERQSVHTALAAEGAGDALFSIFLEDKGSSTGFKGLLDGSTAIGMSSRAVKAEEVAEFLAAGLGDPGSFEQEHAIAIDGLLIIVHPENMIGGLTFEQVSGLLSGRIVNWSEVGGADLPVTVYSRNTESGTFSTINDTFLKPYSVELSPSANIVSGNAQLSDAVFADPGAIGYVGFAYQKDTRPVDIVSDCGTVAIPSAFSAKTGEYPLQRTLYLYNSQNELPPMAAALIDYATSFAATPFVEKSGFIGYSVEAESMARRAEILSGQIETMESPSEKALMAELFAELGEWERLSTTFRFKTGSSKLENQSRRDLERLAAFIAENGEGREYTFVGFTDSDGPVEANRKLGLERAESMRAELQAILDPSLLGTVSIDAKGYGEVNPVGCNTDFAGQRLNRRVEIWMR